ncbi:head-tail connector protein [Thalassobius sp. Cn5-15]|uniref:head-tail connector protein n=1 Tax=Thalassobius sp. Cn5-15 TaxID=2917763 RepID=UPI001EF2DDE2|nr:head-tail connector protein [Thalassobius sp. Cn5-15]MCG7492070.1 head-tail connector protein [Thalassobius sp. Cn5-15]
MLHTMTLQDITPVAPEALPMAELRDHLRLGSGFATSDLQDDLLIGFLRAALAAIEARTGKAILTRMVQLRLSTWGDPCQQALPLAPVQSVARLTLTDPDGDAEEVDPSRYHLIADSHRPRLIPRGSTLPLIPAGGEAEVQLSVGFGDWQAVPPDLAQAVLMLAAHYYEYRDDIGLSSGCMPFGVTALIERHRDLRIGGAS